MDHITLGFPREIIPFIYNYATCSMLNDIKTSHVITCMSYDYEANPSGATDQCLK